MAASQLRIVAKRDGPPTVVIVEDDRTLLEVIAEALVDEGCRVVPLADWKDAHSVVRREQPDVVLLDLVSDGRETGWPVLDHLTLDPRTRDIPVVLTTGAAESIQQRRPALLPQYGISVLTKPFDLDALWAAVAQHLRCATNSIATSPESA
jgi:CheY-like chemotaxis protein